MTDIDSLQRISSRRDRRISDVCDLVTQVMNLRPPQAEALRKLAALLRRLPRPLVDCSDEEVRSFLTEGEVWQHVAHPVFTAALATGVGKTRLAGAIIALFYLSKEARTFLVLAPRRAVLRRFSDAFDPQFREYLFVEEGLVPEPYVIAADQIGDPAAVEAMPDAFRTGPTIYLLSPQLISTSDRFSGENAFTGRSAAEHLRNKRDLVVIADEAHHVGGLGRTEAAKWTEAIRALTPKLQLGLTATPRGEDGENILFEYPLPRALIEQLYTKDVHLLVRNFESGLVPDEDVDRATIAYALDRLNVKEKAIERSTEPPFPQVKPVCVFFARDIEHAEWMTSILTTNHAMGEEEVLLTHSRSSKSEDEIERLLSIESTNNPVRVVVNVQELTEGWDVVNVYVVAPLRAMATFQGALQAMGRGLRLPAGKRVGQPELDSLDVVCFGKVALKGIVEKATTWLGKDASETTGGLVVDDFETGARVSLPLLIPIRKDVEKIVLQELESVHQDVSTAIAPEAIRTSVRMAVEDLELAKLKSKFSREQQVRLPRDVFLDASTVRVLKIAGRHLSDDLHYHAIRGVVKNWLDVASPEDELVDFDPVSVGEAIGRIIVDGARQRALEYQPTGSKVDIQFEDFDVSVVTTSPVDEDPTPPKIRQLPITIENEFLPGDVIRGVDGHAWELSLHEAYSFDSFPEIRLAWLLDHAEEVDWWCRNQPRRIRIPTAAGLFSPDFVCRHKSGSIQLLEVKGDQFWSPPDSEARVKARSAARWVKLQSDAANAKFGFGVALESDIKVVSSYGALIERLRDS